MDSEILTQLNSVNLDHVAKKIVQDQEKLNKGKYKHVPRQIDKNGIEYLVTEYVCPNMGDGIDIIFYKTIDDKEYSKSVCYGEEADSRESDWAEIINEV